MFATDFKRMGARPAESVPVVGMNRLEKAGEIDTLGCADPARSRPFSVVKSRPERCPTPKA